MRSWMRRSSGGIIIFLFFFLQQQSTFFLSFLFIYFFDILLLKRKRKRKRNKEDHYSFVVCPSSLIECTLYSDQPRVRRRSFCWLAAADCVAASDLRKLLFLDYTRNPFHLHITMYSDDVISFLFLFFLAKRIDRLPKVSAGFTRKLY